jgi:PQQ-dependent dehydrogenase (methanol/ethanol family)
VLAVLILAAASLVADGAPALALAASQRKATAGWPDVHGGESGWHFSPLEEVDARNVEHLQLAWTHSPDLQTEGLESLPVAADGLIAYCSGSDHVWVLDGATGRLRWQVRVGNAETGASRIPGAAEPPCRGLALDSGTLYFAGAGGHVVAWNAATGEQRWESRVLPREQGRGALTGPPMIIGDRVVLGSTVTAPGERAVLLGLDTRSGKEQWRLEVIGATARPSSRWESQASWGKEGENASGGSAWMPGAYDPLTRQLFWGTGSPVPLFDGVGAYYLTYGPRPGNNLFTAGVLALDPATGVLRGWHQEIPHEVWVRDSAASETLLLERQGRRYLVHPNRSGLVFVYDTNLRVQRVWSAVKNLNIARSVDPQTGIFRRRHDLNPGDRNGVCPWLEGGFPGLPGAYSPQTGLWYKVGAEWCMDIDLDRPSAPLSAAALLGGHATPVPPRDGRVRAHLDARDPLTGAKVWTVEFPEPPLASLLVTAGRLLFVADGRGSLQALDAGTGRRLWHADQRDGHAGGLLSYQAGGHQYVALVAGWDSRAHPAWGKLFGPPYSGDHTPHASLRAFRLP